jgi:uncharacterized protein
MEAEFNDDHLKSEIEGLSHEQKTLFMLSCCERLYPNYIAFNRDHKWGSPSILREALDIVWELFEGKTMEEEKIRALFQRCDEVTPDTEDFDSVLVSPALDSAVTVTLLLEFILNDSIDKVTEVASLARDTVDMYVQELENMAPDDPNLEKKILEHRLMQKELKRQREDIETLKRIDLSDKVTYEDVKKKWHRVKTSNIELY